MKKSSTRAAIGSAALLVAMLTMTACGTDNNTPTDSGSQTPSVAASQNTDSGTDAPVETNTDTGTEQETGTESETTESAPAADGATFEGAGFSCATGTLRSTGSTAQGKVMSTLITDYNAKCNASINDYGGGGSGKGISDFLAGQTDFSGTDSAMNADQLAEAASDRCEAGAINLPMVTGPIAIAFNIPDVETLVLTPTVLTGIFSSEITNWNDPAIAELNKDVTLPDLAISSVHRAEDSGTTDNFTTYLATAGGWTFDGGKAWTAPGGTGAQGSAGVATAVKSTVGSVGYVEWGFATQEQLSIAQIDNGGGPVALTAESAGLAVQAAEIVGTDGDLALKLDYATTAPGAYPVILVTYEVACTTSNGDVADLLKSFLGYAATDGQQKFVDDGAAPLPAPIQEKVVAAIQAMS